MNKVLKSKSRLYRAIWILEKDANGMLILAIAKTYPKPGLPTISAIGFLKKAMIAQIKRDIIKFVQKATLVLWTLSSSSLKSCWTRYFWKPASEKISANDISIVSVTTTPKASGASNRANIILLIGVTTLAVISVITLHFIAVFILVLKLLSVIYYFNVSSMKTIKTK